MGQTSKTAFCCRGCVCHNPSIDLEQPRAPDGRLFHVGRRRSLAGCGMEAPTADGQTQVAHEPPNQMAKPVLKKHAPAPSRVPSIVVGLVVAAVAGLSIWYLVRGEPLLVQGEVDATRRDIAARVDGRVAEIPIVRGQNVAAGAVLVKIDNPETIAKNE